MKTEDEKIVVLNSNKKTWKSDLIACLEGVMVEFMYPGRHFYHNVSSKERVWRKNVERTKNIDNVVVFSPPEDFKIKSHTVDRRILEEGYKQGINVGKTIAQYMFTKS